MYRYLSIFKILLFNLAISGFILVWHKEPLYTVFNVISCLVNLGFIYVAIALSGLKKFINQNHERLFIGRKRSQLVVAPSIFLMIHLSGFLMKFIHNNIVIFDVCWSSVVMIVFLFQENISFYVHGLFKKGRRVAVVGYNDHSIKIAQHLKDKGKDFFYGHIDFKEGYDKAGDSYFSPYLDFAKKNKINEFYLSVPAKTQSEINTLAEEAEKHCIRVKFIAHDLNLENSNYRTQYISGLPVLKKYDEPLTRLHNQTIKRAFDVLVSGCVTVFILSWLIPLVGLLIKLESRGPIFFSQQRSGRNNKPFTCFKFRSMEVNNLSDAVQATKNDSRVTKIGAFLRKTSIDELPQFLNVLKGQMSIVGPRPHMLRHTVEYNEQVSSYMVRLWLKPGLTGWAQANGYRGEVKNIDLMRKRVEHDIWYMENWSLMLDMKIFWLTLRNVIKGEENAY